jgi:cell division protein FtsB
VRLRASVARQEAENERLTQRNARLKAEVSDLKTGFAALEERARADLGMIGQGESFFLWSPEATVARTDD